MVCSLIAEENHLGDIVLTMVVIYSFPQMYLLEWGFFFFNVCWSNQKKLKRPFSPGAKGMVNRTPDVIIPTWTLFCFYYVSNPIPGVINYSDMNSLLFLLCFWSICLFRTLQNPVVIRGFSAPGLALFFGFTSYMIWRNVYLFQIDL